MNTQPRQGEIKLPVRVVANANYLGFRLVGADRRDIFIGSANEEDAQAIAHALNSREELLSAAQGAYDLLCSLRAEQTAPKTLKQLAAALAKAKGEKI